MDGFGIEVRPTAFAAQIDVSCEIEHKWYDTDVVLTLRRGDDSMVGVELELTDEAFDKLASVVDAARAARRAELTGFPALTGLRGALYNP
jgi:hypothetical protein